MTRKRQERQHEQEQMAKAKRFCERKLWYVLAKILTLFSTEFFMLTQLLGLRDLDPTLRVINSQKPKYCLFAQYLPNCWMELSRVCMETTWNHDEQLITFGDLG